MNAPLMTPPYLESLNESQREAVEATEGPVLVLAGAGTGKTRVLTTRLGHILMTGKARPQELLAVTFTNKAAREMKDRISALIGRPVEGWWLGTFHALAARLLRRHAEVVGLTPNFTILDTDDQLRLLKQLIVAEDLDDKKWPARALLAAIERWKDRGLTPDKVTSAEQADYADGIALRLYRQYQERLGNLNACDFGDLLLHNLTLFAKEPQVLAQYQQQFRYILVDEYQDSNVAQYLWLRLLAQGRRNLCCVGDDDQSIYGWRGAEVGNILRFESDFPGARIIRLERNYRSTGHILAAASGLIAHNQGRLGKTLHTDGEVGDQIRIRGVWDGEEEARQVGEELEALQRRGTALGKMAILVRAGFQTREFEERFIKLGLPYRVLGGSRFYERQEVRDALAYLRLVNQPSDDLAFERIVNKPRRGIGDTTLRQVHATGRALGLSLVEAARALAVTDELKPASRRALGALVGDLDRWRAMRRGPAPCRARRNRARRIRLYRHAPGGQIAGCAGPAGESEGAGRRHGRVREPRRLPRACQPGDGERRGRSARHGQYHDPAQRQGAGVRRRLPAGLGGGAVPAASAPSTRTAPPGWRRSAASPMSASPAPASGSRSPMPPTGASTTCGRIRCPRASSPRFPREHVEEDSAPGLRAMAEPALSRFEGPARQLGPAAPFRPADRGPGAAGVSRDAAYPPGARIFHRKFGYGSVVAAEGDKLDIAFDKAGAKKVIASFVVPAEQAS